MFKTSEAIPTYWEPFAYNLNPDFKKDGYDYVVCKTAVEHIPKEEQSPAALAKKENQ